jgi:hypothetical protein
MRWIFHSAPLDSMNMASQANFFNGSEAHYNQDKEGDA